MNSNTRGGGVSVWIEGARPRTLVASIIPVLVGTAVAIDENADSWGSISWARLVLTFVVALSIQIGVNYANDYSDGKRGADDTSLRKGPPRLVGSGIKSPKSVLIATGFTFAVTAGAGLALSVLVGWELLVVGALSLLAAWTYTGGSHPYGYKALGEISVFIFFGLVATVGTTYIQIQELPGSAWLAGVGLGLMSSGILIANNFRDIKSDKLVGKITLAVKLGVKGTLGLYGFVLLGASAVAVILILANPSGNLTERIWLLSAILGTVFSITRLEPKQLFKIKFTIVPELGRSVLGLYIYGLGMCVGFLV